ncbi:MAG: HAD-IA family hydrolase [Rhodospirillaceae bacterium]
MTLKLALFDCDGTLIDSQHAIVSAMAAAWRSEGLAEPDPHRVRRVVGLSLVEAVARLLPEGDAAFHLRLAERYKLAFAQERLAGLHGEPVFPGVRRVLEALEGAGVLMGVATGKSMRGLAAVLEQHDLGRFFVTLQTADFGPGKPDPDMIFRALAEAGGEPETTVMIGDTVYDIEMAVRAGARAIGVSWGYHESEELLAAGAGQVVDSAEALLPAIMTLA